MLTYKEFLIEVGKSIIGIEDTQLNKEVLICDECYNNYHSKWFVKEDDPDNFPLMQDLCIGIPEVKHCEKYAEQTEINFSTCQSCY